MSGKMGPYLVQPAAGTKPEAKSGPHDPTAPTGPAPTHNLRRSLRVARTAAAAGGAAQIQATGRAPWSALPILMLYPSEPRE